jgi:hypothetical protein
LARAVHATGLAQITENKKVEARKPLIFRNQIVGFCLEKAPLQDSQDQRFQLVAPLAVLQIACSAPRHHLAAK